MNLAVYLAESLVGEMDKTMVVSSVVGRDSAKVGELAVLRAVEWAVLLAVL